MPRLIWDVIQSEHRNNKFIYFNYQTTEIYILRKNKEILRQIWFLFLSMR